MESDVHILIVDDSRAIRDFVVQALGSQETFTVSEARDGAEGLEMALADPPDLILLDLEMPRLNGLQVVDGLREHQAGIPVILITSHGSEAIAVELFRKGVKDYLNKPFTAEEMLVAIERALTEVRLRREKEALTQRLAVSNRQLQRRVHEMDILYRVGKSVTSLLSREQLMERIMDAVFYVIGAEEAALMMVDKESGRLRTEVHRQRVPGKLQGTAGRSAEELAVDTARKGDVTATGAMLSAPLKVGGKIIGTLGLGNRVSAKPFTTHDRQLLMALADYAAIAVENMRLYEEVRQADRAKSAFVSLVVHELGTPMTSILGYTDVLANKDFGSLVPEQERFVGVIRRNVRRMQLLVSDLQDVSRIETGQLLLEPRPTTLADVLEDALQATQIEIDARSQQLTVESPRNLPPVRADPARLIQILINLFSNAYKYTPEGGHIRVRVWLQNGYVHCAVSDTGIGISPKNMAKLFTKFFRSDDPTVRDIPGTGLGLSIVKSLVELQGGTIEVESEVGEGTTFTFTVPVAARE
ncbi:MAG: ATP-binding protein [Chloroflexota bacterium]|nr:ATP-binding protein [Chloroflexota bacterium]